MIDIENKQLLECPKCGQVYLVKVSDLQEGKEVDCPECDNKENTLREYKETIKDE